MDVNPHMITTYAALYVGVDMKGRGENAIVLLNSSLFPLRFRDSSGHKRSLFG